MKIGGRHSNNLRYAGDLILLAESSKDLKRLLMKVKNKVPKQDSISTSRDKNRFLVKIVA